MCSDILTLLGWDRSAYSFIQFQTVMLKAAHPAALSPVFLQQSSQEAGKSWSRGRLRCPGLGSELCTMFSAPSHPSPINPKCCRLWKTEELKTKSGTSNAPDLAAGFKSTAPAFEQPGAHSQSVHWPLAWCSALYLGSAVTSWASPVCGLKQYLLWKTEIFTLYYFSCY